MTEMTMIEKVARAIWDANGWHAPNDEDRRTAPWALCRRQARAAIEAMREPTEAMTHALKFYGMLDGDTDQTWDKVIDAALTPD